MAKVLQVIDVDSDGHKVRLDDGRVVYMPHGADHPHIGEEFTEPAVPVKELKAEPVPDAPKPAKVQKPRKPPVAK